MKDHLFFNMEVTLASFQIASTLPFDREKLKRSHRGNDNGRESSFRIRLFIASGPAALPNFKAFNITSTSCGVVDIESRL